jgi:hypothetical protein
MQMTQENRTEEMRSHCEVFFWNEYNFLSWMIDALPGRELSTRIGQIPIGRRK